MCFKSTAITRCVLEPLAWAASPSRRGCCFVDCIAAAVGVLVPYNWVERERQTQCRECSSLLSLWLRILCLQLMGVGEVCHGYVSNSLSVLSERPVFVLIPICSLIFFFPKFPMTSKEYTERILDKALVFSQPWPAACTSYSVMWCDSWRLLYKGHAVCAA